MHKFWPDMPLVVAKNVEKLRKGAGKEVYITE